MPVYSVTEFIALINAQLQGVFTVEGEVSRYGISQGKWVFFDLKDATGLVSCFSTVYKIKTPLEEGMRVRVMGYSKVREQTGRFSFTVEAVELVGEGAIKRAYELLKKKLEAEGLFSPERKRPIPAMPKTIGVVASRDSAAWGDFKRIVNNRWGGVELQLYHALVQGDGAEAEVVEAFNYFNTLPSPPDVLVVIRGGGSAEDLAAFNTEGVVRAVAGSRVPVVSGVGHERDVSLCDLVADVRASTPSNAAELVVPDKEAVGEDIITTAEHFKEKMSHAITVTKHRVEQVAGTLDSIFENYFDSLKEFLASSERLFGAHDPKRILARGFSITRNVKGKIVRAAKDVDKGEKIVVELGSGSIEGVVE